MTIREIIGPDNPVLRKKARPVDKSSLEDPAMQRLIDDMIETMREAPGVGLAAPQVAVGQRLAVIEYGDDLPEDAPPGTPEPPKKLWVIVNPEIIDYSSEMVEGSEGCLSLPGYAGTVMRSQAVTVKALNRRGKPIKIKARDWLARIFQHEIDHLDGVLYIDRATKVWRVPEDEAEGDARLRE
jgi:peptide deformylase